MEWFSLVAPFILLAFFLALALHSKFNSRKKILSLLSVFRQIKYLETNLQLTLQCISTVYIVGLWCFLREIIEYMNASCENLILIRLHILLIFISND